MKFDNIEYLLQGTERQKLAYLVLRDNQIFSKLQQFDPILVGTIPINIDIENSDLDIICYFIEKNVFIKTLIDSFKEEQSFILTEKQDLESPAVVANFILNEFEIEIFGQNIPTKKQHAYRHLIIEYHLLKYYGESFRQQIIELKRQGYKTEPAFGIALGLEGNPYLVLLEYENKLNLLKSADRSGGGSQ